MEPEIAGETKKKTAKKLTSEVGRLGGWDGVKISTGVCLILAPLIMRWLRLPRSRESPGLLSSAPWMEIHYDTGLDRNLCLFGSASIPSS